MQRQRGVELLGPLDWGAIFLPRTPLVETALRGSLIYLALSAMPRFTFKREAGGTSITTLLVVVLIADAAQNAMADDYTSITDGVLLVLTILGWSFLLDWIGTRIPAWPLSRTPVPSRSSSTAASSAATCAAS